MPRVLLCGLPISLKAYYSFKTLVSAPAKSMHTVEGTSLLLAHSTIRVVFELAIITHASALLVNFLRVVLFCSLPLYVLNKI